MDLLSQAEGSVSLIHFLLLLGLSFFLGLAVEEVSIQEKVPGPGGVRTFPILSLTGLGFFLLDPLLPEKRRKSLAFREGI